MNAADVIKLCQDLQNLGVRIWLDGGWGVDALLGRQTREHTDVDIIVEGKHLRILQNHLQEQGYEPVERDDTCAWNFVLGDSQGREVDVHVINLDGQGNGIYGPLERGMMYPAPALMGAGSISGLVVYCLTPEYQLESHTGYKLKQKDYQDCLALCEKFGLKLPKDYDDFRI